MFEINGYKVKFYHVRFNKPTLVPEIAGTAHSIQAITSCVMLKDDKEYMGMAFCSAEDNFSKNIGRKIALSRALKEAGFARKIKEQFWNEYFKVRGKVG